MRRSILCLCALALVVPAGVLGHDYWLEQKPWSIAPGATYTVHLLVGDRLYAELERPLQHEMTMRYEWHRAEETIDLLEAMPDSALPVFEGGPTPSPASLLVMERKFYTIDTTVRGFLEFLEHEEQQELGEVYKGVAPETPLTRRYARAIKALVRTGTPVSGNLHNKRVGQPIEILLLQNPHASPLGTKMDVHVRFGEKHLADQLVKTFVKQSDGTVTVQRSRTDERGRAQFVLDRAGLWMVRVTYLRQCDDCDTDWDTYYATYNFVYP